MQDSSFEKPLVIHPINSLSLKLVVIIPHLLATLLFFTLLEVNWIVNIVLAVMVALSFIYYFQWHVSKSLKKSVVSAIHLNQHNKQNAWSGGRNNAQSEQDDWIISLANQKDIAVELLPSSFVSTWWIILNFKDQKRSRYTLILPFDAITPEQHRQLRVRIKVSEV